jgi:hypothetical protein
VECTSKASEDRVQGGVEIERMDLIESDERDLWHRSIRGSVRFGPYC